MRTWEHSGEREELVQCCTIPLHSDQKQISNSSKSARILHEHIEILEIPRFSRSSVRILLESYEFGDSVRILYISAEFNRILQDSVGISIILANSSEFWWILQDSIWISMILTNSSEFWWIWQHSVGISRVLANFVEFCGNYRNSDGFVHSPGGFCRIQFLSWSEANQNSFVPTLN